MIQRAMTVEDLCKKLKPLFGKKIDELYFRYSVAGSLEEKNEIYSLLTSLYQKHLAQLLDKGVLLEPPKEKDVLGDYPLGKINYAGKELYDFSLREEDWPRHVCVTGMSGSGKTTFAFQVLKNFIKKDKPFLVFDWKKSFRPLVGIDNSLMAFTVGNDAVSNLFKVNINRPPKGVNPKEWINTLCDLLTESFSASYGVHKILLETLDEAYESWGVYQGGNHYPNWQHIKKLLEQKTRDAKGRETGWYESAMRIATVLTFGSFGKIVNYDGKRSLSIEDLFDKRVIFELNSLSNIEKKFFAEYVLTYIFKLKKAQENTSERKFNYAILVDEAHNIFLKRQTNFMSESVTDMIYREMREYGTSLICLDQHASKLSDTVTGNSACHIAFQQQLPQDLEEISQLMQLRDRKDMFTQLSVGEGIVKMSDRYTSPFLIKAPFVDLRKDSVNDEKIATRMQFMLDQNEIKKYDPKFLDEISQSKKTESLETPEVVEAPIVEPNREYSVSIQKLNFDIPKFSVEPAVSSQKAEASSKISNNLSEIPSEKPNFEKVEKSDLSKSQNILYSFAKEKRNEGWEILEIEKILNKGLHEKAYSLNDVLIVMNKILEDEFSKVKKEESSISFCSCSLPSISHKGYFEEREIFFEEDSEEKKIEIFDKLKEIAFEDSEEKEEVVVEDSASSNDSEKDSEEVSFGKSQVIEVEEQSIDNKAQEASGGDSFFQKTEEVVVLRENSEEERFLLFLKENPEHEKPITEIYKLIGLSARKGNVIKNKLMEKGLIVVEEIRDEKGWKKFIRLN